MIRFSSPSAGDVQMLQAHAERLIESMGKQAGTRGVITHAEIGGALESLRAAIRKDAAVQTPAVDDSDDPDEKERRAQHVDLGRRAYPLIDMLERASKQGKDVTWGI